MSLSKLWIAGYQGAFLRQQTDRSCHEDRRNVSVRSASDVCSFGEKDDGTADAEDEEMCRAREQFSETLGRHLEGFSVSKTERRSLS